MAAVTTASNNKFGKWVPYYYKPFYLGETDGVGEDGVVHITQVYPTSGGSDITIEAQCLSDKNCGFYYTLIFTHASPDKYYVKKYDLNDTLIDTIYASETSPGADGLFWATGGRAVSIDEGVMIALHSTTGFITSDIYKITMPTADQMIRKRVYHGGYSTFMRMPYEEEVAYHSDILPCNLLGKNITVVFNNICGIGSSSSPTQAYSVVNSLERTTGNQAVSLYLEWNVDRDGATSATAGGNVDANYTWGSGETWQLGSVMIDDADPISTSDFPNVPQIPSNDMAEASSVTGTTQVLNATVSGRAGHARIRCSYDDGDGGSVMLAHNQYWPLILLIA